MMHQISIEELGSLIRDCHQRLTFLVAVGLRWPDHAQACAAERRDLLVLLEQAQAAAQERVKGERWHG